jgi:hypothetical protein
MDVEESPTAEEKITYSRRKNHLQLWKRLLAA